MPKGNYNIDEIHIGDEVLINDYHQTHHNLFWRVVNKIAKNRLIIEIKEMGFAEKYIVLIKDVLVVERNCIRLNKLNLS